MNRWLRLTRRGALCTRWPSIGPALLPGGPASLIGHREKHSGLKAEYEALVAAGKLTFDPHQLRAVEHLQRLQRELDGYQPAQSPSLFQQVRMHHGTDTASHLVPWYCNLRDVEISYSLEKLCVANITFFSCSSLLAEI